MDGLNADKLKSSALAGDADAMLGLADEYLKAGKHGMAAMWLNMAAEAGNMIAVAELADLYYQGKGVARDYVKAVELYTKAAEAGNPYGMYKLGCIICADQGSVSKIADIDVAVEYLKKASNFGNSDAMLEIGSLIQNGAYGDYDVKSVIRWYERAANHGNAEAAYRLYGLYSAGLEIEKNKSEAEKWKIKAIDLDKDGSIRKKVKSSRAFKAVGLTLKIAAVVGGCALFLSVCAACLG